MSLARRFIQNLGWLRRSSTLRLTLLLSAIFAVGITIAIFVALLLGENAIERRVDETLRTIASSTVVQDAPEDSPSVIIRAPDDLQGLPTPFQRAVERQSSTIDLNRDFLRSDVWRVLVTQDSQGNAVMVALPLEDSEEAQALLAGILWTTAAFVIALTLAIGFGVGLIAQRRLGRIHDTLNKLAAGELGARTQLERSKDDLDDVAGQLDRTASELERLVTQTRHLSASIAHDLRTPLARLRARLEDLPASDEKCGALEEVSRMTGIFDTIMRVARIEAAQGRDGFEPVPLGPLVHDLAETFGPVIEDSGKQLKLEIRTPATVGADRQMLVQAIANLIQNALVHGGTEITVIADGRTLGVADNGDGVPADQYDEIVKPMVQLDTARSTEGTGLGLALVRAVADRHGAQLTLAPNDPGHEPKGLRITLNFADL